jgi:hypothetical protein
MTGRLLVGDRPDTDAARRMSQDNMGRSPLHEGRLVTVWLALTVLVVIIWLVRNAMASFGEKLIAAAKECEENGHIWRAVPGDGYICARKYCEQRWPQ